MSYNIGDIKEEIFCFTQKQVDIFIELTGDNNPIHYDIKYSENTIFKKPIIHGFLSASIFSKILGISMPGYGTIYLKQEINFKLPMYVGIEYKCKVEILDINGSKYTLRTIITNEKEEITIDGLAVVLNKN